MVAMAKRGPYKPDEEKRTAITSVRSTPASRELWEQAAQKSGVSLNSWIIAALDRAAKRAAKKK